jgi:hypothetical protein
LFGPLGNLVINGALNGLITGVCMATEVLHDDSTRTETEHRTPGCTAVTCRSWCVATLPTTRQAFKCIVAIETPRLASKQALYEAMWNAAAKTTATALYSMQGAKAGRQLGPMMSGNAPSDVMPLERRRQLQSLLEAKGPDSGRICQDVSSPRG